VNGAESGRAPVKIDLTPIDARPRSPLGGLQPGEHEALIEQLIEQTRRHYGPTPRPYPWQSYLASDPATGMIVGTCAFKTPPDAEGCVEIAYFTFPGFEGKGYATAMARALVKLAREASDAVRIIAHTLPETNASGSVLRKAGMRLVGEVVEPEDGLVWRWEYGAPGTGAPEPLSD
jgi:RimJ/RimL family protein N-acetyltransferase